MILVRRLRRSQWVNMICYHCKKKVAVDSRTPLTSRDECPHCRISLRCCLNCRFYDTYRPNHCAEPQAERVANKDRANYCNYFEPAPDTGPSSQQHSQKESRKEFDALFKKK